MAVMAAAVSSVSAAAETRGIPERTLGYWFDHPDFADVRAKTRDDLAAESMGMAHRVLGEIQRRIDEFEPRDLSVLFGILTDKGQLLSGAATDRLETRDVTETMGDHEKAALRDAIDDWLTKGPTAEETLALGQMAKDSLPVEP